AVFSAEGSYTYGVKTADGTTTTDSVSSSKTASQTFNPVGDAKEFAPDSIGLLLYSAPRFVSKAYRIIRWDRGEFPGTKRNVFLTVVSNRSLQLVPYVLDHPELGPLTGSPRAYNPALKELTLGIAPVKPTSSLRDWRFTGPVPDIGKFPSFKNSNASITASLESAGDFAFNFVDTHSEGKTHLESKTNKSTLKVSGGIKGLFNVSVSGSSAGTSTFSTSSTFTTSLGTGIAGNYPLLWPQRIGTISVQANLVYPDSASADQKPAPTWIPDAFKGRCAPFLLTWSQVATDPPIAARKSWRLPRHHAYGEDATGE
ncbi:MAG: hypothetical protein ACREKL_12360, partial [Chthoniobacterales bacterium]